MNARKLRGISLVEMMVTLAIMAIMLTMAAPSFSAWLQNGQIRNAAESIQNGLTLARAEAVRRNTTVRFQLVSDLTNSCALLDSGTNWVVSQGDVSGLCGTAPDVDPPMMIQFRAAQEGMRNVAVNGNGVSAVTFSANGRASAAASIDLTNPLGGGCATQADRSLPMRCLRITVSTGGQIRMCDPARDSSDPQGC